MPGATPSWPCTARNLVKLIQARWQGEITAAIAQIGRSG